jgi:hypothetical protein
MATAETARLIASLELQDKFSGPAGRIDSRLAGLQKHFDQTGTRAYRAGQQVGTGIRSGAIIAAAGIGFLATQVGLGLRSLSNLDDVVTQTNAVLKSTKGAAGENAQAIRDLANKYEDLNATIDDTVIQSGENLLLTFTNIRKQAFEPTLQAALDMNQALGGGEAGLQGTIQRLGKALNDPVKGLTALQRVGVTFTKTQKDQIKAAIEAGDTFKAQGIILAELNKRFGGSFLAGGTTTTGKVAKFKDAIDDLQRVLATALLPVIGKVSDALSKFLGDPAVVRGAKELGESIAGLFSDKNLAAGADILKGAFQTAKDAAPIVAAAAKTTFGFVQGAVGLFKSLPPQLQTLLVSGFAINKLTGGLVTNLAGGLISSVLKQLVSGVVNVQGAVVNVAGVPGGLPGAVGAAEGAAGGGIRGLLGNVLKVAVVGLAAGVAIELAGELGKQIQENQQQSADIATNVAKEIKEGNTAALLKAQAALQQGISDLTHGGRDRPTAGGESAELRNLREQLKLVNAALGPLPGKIADDLVSSSLMSGTERNLGKLSDDLAGLPLLQRNANEAFGKMLVALRLARKPEDIRKAVAEAVAQVVGKSRGSVENTRATLAGLRAALARTHDPKLEAAIRSAIAKVQAKIVGREYAQRQIAGLDKVLRSNATGNRKIDALNATEKALLNRGLPHAAAQIGARTDRAKEAISRSMMQSARGIESSVNRKKLAVTVNNTTSTNVSVSGRAVFAQQRSFSRYYSTSSAGPGK